MSIATDLSDLHSLVEDLSNNGLMPDDERINRLAKANAALIKLIIEQSQWLALITKANSNLSSHIESLYIMIKSLKKQEDPIEFSGTGWKAN